MKEQPQLEKVFWEKTERFIKDAFDPSIRTHKLSGKLKDLWSFSIDYQTRVLFFFTTDDNAVFIDIGSHDEVY
jgi:mRNA-degrading endonuclease YafQ of YafQ-DinJ toxin-antitoxin module